MKYRDRIVLGNARITWRLSVIILCGTDVASPQTIVVSTKLHSVSDMV